MKIILASSSPRRRAFMEETGLNFEIRKAETDESYPQGLKREGIALYLAEKKASETPLLNDDEIIIAADTVVWTKHHLDKPANRQEAIEMLEELSGNWHEVITAVALRDRNKSVSFFEITRVHFVKLTKEQIEYYVDRFAPYDKAGAYAIQQWIGTVGIDRIEGSVTNVVGLPVSVLLEKLKQWPD